MNTQIILRKYRKDDEASLAAIIREAWHYDELCTPKTAAKLANGIVDTPVLLAAKAHLRNGRPLAIGISTNDALGINFKNIGKLMNMKNIYFVPFGQDDCVKKPNSLVCDGKQVVDTINEVMAGRQIQPVIL